MAGAMTYMQRQAARRTDPSKILPGAHRAIVVMRNYFTEDGARTPGTGRVAKYARGPDYHHTLRAPLEALVSHVRRLGNRDTVARAYVDAGPVPERELAHKAGLGWIGRNTMIIHPRFGSHLLLAAVLTNLEIAIDRPFQHDRCGTCRRCVEACPTKAITEERLIDSRLCISYLTIEFGDNIAEELQPNMGNWIFGCDECQDVCPWNVKFARHCDDETLSLSPEFAELNLDELIGMSTEEFRIRFAHSPLKRTGFEGMRRNASIAKNNLEMQSRTRSEN